MNKYISDVCIHLSVIVSQIKSNLLLTEQGHFLPVYCHITLKSTNILQQFYAVVLAVSEFHG